MLCVLFLLQTLHLPLRKQRRKHLSLIEKNNSSSSHKVLHRKLSREKFITHKMSNTTHNSIIENNTNNNNTRTNGTQACAACKYQRRKCASDCLLAPYFPHHLHHKFLNAHKLFGVSNITKIIRPLPQPQKDQAMITICYESDARAADPVGGSCRIIRNLTRQIEFAYAELDLVLQQLAICRAAAAADTVSLMCDPQTQPQQVGTESEDVTIHGDNIINNDDDNHAINVYKADDEVTSPLREQTTAEGDDNSRPEDQLYLQDIRQLDENNEEDDGGIGEYFLEEGEIINDNNNVILSLQDMDASWDMHDALAYCLHDKEGFLNECGDLKPNVVDMGGERIGLNCCDDETQILEHSDEAISKDNKVVLKEETDSCRPEDEKPIVREDFVTIEDAQSHDLKSSATLLNTS